MSDTKYSADLLKEIPDIEVLKLRQENTVLQRQLETAQELLKEHGLEDILPKQIEPAELIAMKQIDILKQLSDKGLPFSSEEVKNLETLVRTLLSIRGKAPMEVEKNKGKKKETAKVADLLEIVRNSPKEQS